MNERVCPLRVAGTHMTVKTSTDQGASWSAGTLVWEGPSAYSQLVPMPEALGLLFEAGESSASETISFTTVAV